MKDAMQIVSSIIAFLTNPEIAIAVLFGWFGNVLWSRHRRYRKNPHKSIFGLMRKTDNTRSTDTSSISAEENNQSGRQLAEADRANRQLSDRSQHSFNDTSGQEFETGKTNDMLPLNEISPSRVAEEVIAPILREVLILVGYLKERGLICTEGIRWSGAKSDGTTWFYSLYQLEQFPEEVPDASKLVEVWISLSVQSITDPPRTELLEWYGHFLGKEGRIAGSWRRTPWNRDIRDDSEESSIPAYNLASLIETIRADVAAALTELQSP